MGKVRRNKYKTAQNRAAAKIYFLFFIHRYYHYSNHDQNEVFCLVVWLAVACVPTAMGHHQYDSPHTTHQNHHLGFSEMPPGKVKKSTFVFFLFLLSSFRSIYLENWLGLQRRTYSTTIYLIAITILLTRRNIWDDGNKERASSASPSTFLLITPMLLLLLFFSLVLQYSRMLPVHQLPIFNNSWSSRRTLARQKRIDRV